MEAMVEGSPGQLADMRVCLSEGMFAALVDGLEVTEAAPPFARSEHVGRLPMS